jgi:DNA invertase Pin-like site-specific DNA recombinase
MNQPKNTQPINNYRTSNRVRENHPNAKLTLKQVQEIRTLGSQGVSTAALAERFSMSKTAIKSILSHRTWKDIPEVEIPPDSAS